MFSKLSFFVFALFFLAVAHEAGAGVIVRAPNNLGLRTGLVGYWSFDGPHLSPTTAADQSGNGNHGTRTNGPLTAPGRIGQALSFDGVNDYVRIANESQFDFERTSTFSVSAWVKVAPFTGSTEYAIVGKALSTGGLTGWEFYVQDTDLKVFLINTWRPNSIGKNSAAAVDDNAWHHVAFTYSGTSLASGVNIYIDGNLSNGTVDDDGLSASILNNVALDIGIDEEATNAPFNGHIDEVRIYNRALSADEIKRLYNIGASKFNVSPKNGTLQNGLVGYWSFDGRDLSGTTAADKSGQGNHGTLTNGPTKAIGKIGQALSFDGVNDYVALMDTPFDFERTDSFSASGWVKYSNTGVQRILLSKENAANPFLGWGFYANGDNTGLPIVYINNNYLTNSIEKQGSINVGDNQWHHIAFTYSGNSDASGVNIYTDGVLSNGTVNRNTLSASILNNTNLGIGSNGLGSYNFFQGPIDEVRIYNRALSADEIKRLYNMGASKLNVASNNNMLKNGLVGYWSFDGSKLSATTAADSSGQGNHGTLTNGPTRAAGKIGQALEFDGVNDYVRTNAVAIPGIYTVAFWFRNPAAPSGTVDEQPFSWNSTSDQGISFSWDHTNALFRQAWGPYDGVFQDLKYTTALQANTWYHMTLTYDGATARAYLNGVQEVSKAIGAASDAGSETINIGAGTGGTQAFEDGLIDEVRIYNRALLADEIKRLYNMGR